MSFINNFTVSGTYSNGDLLFTRADGQTYIVELINNFSFMTIDNIITTIYNYTPPVDGVYNVEYIVNATASADGYGSTCYGAFKVISGVVTAIGTNSLDRKSNFGPAVTNSITTDGVDILFNVRGLSGVDIYWNGNFKIINRI